jgi:alanyl-tRNA synthetase
MMTANEIRDSYLKFFESKGHVIVPSAPIVVKDDPTLMFTNAGMNQWKDIILGTKDPNPRRRTDSQKCLRVSGKHNDLEEVGRDSALSHHTMFEMLGNWSFGDYFKEGAIDYAYEYLVNVLHLDPKDLYVTVFEGDPSENIARDDEAAGYWEKHFPKNHIVNGNKHDNFWEMGDTGPCGPCSEIHIDFRPEEEKKKVPGELLVNKDHPQVIEIWNIVFMQFNRKADGSLEPLKMHVIDTGLGFERLVRLLQGKNSNYDTDIFTPIIEEIERLSGHKYNHTFPEGPNGEGVNAEEKVDIAIRVVADHLRAVAFAIADGQLPSNAKAGYVIRRILRRAVRYAYTFLDQKDAFMYKLVPVLVAEMGGAYPELKAQQDLITKVMKQEEDSFLRTLERGINLLSVDMDELKAAGKTELEGEKAFRLFDTYGFPLDLTELICGENGFTVDAKGFDEEMAKQKERARNAAAVENSDWVNVHEGEQEFVGYDTNDCDAHILRYRKVTQKKNVFYEVVLDQTPFYGEMGGQVGDKGKFVFPDETIEVVDTKRENNQSIHIVKKLPKDITADLHAEVDAEKREGSACNHTATHLLDYALKQVLGEQTEQRGSYVDDQILRFDFNYFQKVSAEQLRQVERIVNKMIREDLPLDEHRDTPIEEAKKLGAVALFGEKYGDKVRVVRFGPSAEFCGGIHVKSTGHIGFFKIISESSVAAGIRRVEALTGKAAEEAIYDVEDTLETIKGMFNNTKDLQKAIQKSIDENAGLKKQVEQFNAQLVQQMCDRLVANAQEVNGVKVVKAVVPFDGANAKDLVFKIRERIPEHLACVIGSNANGKPMLSVMFSDDMVKEHSLNAGQIVREAAKLIKGGGGGQPYFAQAGGKDLDGLNAAVEKAVSLFNIG